MYKMLNSYYGGEVIYRQYNDYSRYTKQFLHYLYMFSDGYLAKDEVGVAREYMELYRK